MDICHVRYGSELFTRHEKSLCTSISTLKAANYDQHVFGQVYDDACDEGLVIVSNRTGKQAVFAVEEANYDQHVLRFWKLIPTRDTVRRLPALKGWTVIVFND